MTTLENNAVNQHHAENLPPPEPSSAPKKQATQKLTKEEKKVLDEYVSHHNPLTTSPLEASFEAHHSPVEKKAKLPAEEKFDKWVYGGISYAAQAAGSVVGAMWFKHWGGKPYFEKASEWVGKNILEHITTKRGAAAANEANTYLIFAALITIGNLFIPPVKYLENHKAKIVSWINDRHNTKREARGGVISEQEHAEQRKAIQEIERAPKQTWGSLFGGRLFGLAGIYLSAFLVGEANNAKMTDFTANAVKKGLESVGAKELAKSANVEHASKIAVLDYVYSIVGATGIYIYSHFIAPPKHAEHKEHAEHAIASETSANAVETAAAHPPQSAVPSADIAVETMHANAATLLPPAPEKLQPTKQHEGFKDRIVSMAHEQTHTHVAAL